MNDAAQKNLDSVMDYYPTIYGNKVFPGIGDWYLGETGYDSQQTDEPVDADRPNNLWEPVEGDRGAHGIFDAQSYEFSPQAWANTHPGWTAVAGAGMAAGAVFLWSRLRRQEMSK